MNRFALDRPLPIRRSLMFFGLGAGTYVLSLTLDRMPGVAHALYGDTVGPFLSKLLSSLTGVLPFSLAEVLVLAAVLWVAVPGARAIWHVAHRRRSPRHALAAGGLRLARDAGVLVTLFYVLWGFNYSNAPLEERLGWAEVNRSSVAELADLATQLVDAANEAYYAIHGREDAGHATQPPGDRRALERAIVEGWKQARSALGLPAHPGAYGRVKTPQATTLYETFGVVGFYFPYTGEAHVRAGVPATEWPQSLAHEKAHQRGIARESEANFWGYLAASHAPHAHARYSAYLFAQYQLLGALARADSARRQEVAARRLPGVQRDVDSARAYWLRLRGPGTEVGRVVNDAFLRTNRVPGGVRSYSRSALLFLAYARTRGGRLTATPAEGN